MFSEENLFRALAKAIKFKEDFIVNVQIEMLAETIAHNPLQEMEAGFAMKSFMEKQNDHKWEKRQWKWEGLPTSCQHHY